MSYYIHMYPIGHLDQQYSTKDLLARYRDFCKSYDFQVLYFRIPDYQDIGYVDAGFDQSIFDKLYPLQFLSRSYNLVYPRFQKRLKLIGKYFL